MVAEYGEWPFAVEAVAMFLDEEPELSPGLLTVGPDVEVVLDQFSEMYIDFPLLPGSGTNTMRLHEVIGISASDLLFVDDEEELEELSFLVDGKIALIGEVAEVAHDGATYPTRL